MGLHLSTRDNRSAGYRVDPEGVGHHDVGPGKEFKMGLKAEYHEGYGAAVCTDWGASCAGALGRDGQGWSWGLSHKLTSWRYVREERVKKTAQGQ